MLMHLKKRGYEKEKKRMKKKSKFNINNMFRSGTHRSSIHHRLGVRRLICRELLVMASV